MMNPGMTLWAIIPHYPWGIFINVVRNAVVTVAVAASSFVLLETKRLGAVPIVKCLKMAPVAFEGRQ